MSDRTGEPKKSYLTSAIRAASEEKERQSTVETSIPENHNAVLPESGIPDEAANLTIKVSKRLRRYWLIEAKKQDTSLTAAIVEALSSRFGQPEI